jgi:hypothetical protein
MDTQGDPRDSKSAFTRVCDALCVAECPSRGRAGIVRFATIRNTDACYTFRIRLGLHRPPAAARA